MPERRNNLGVMRKVFLIGTNHEFQMVTPRTAVTEDQFEKFRTLLRELIKQHSIRGIAEEMSLESLRKWRCPDPSSIAYQLAKELGIAHRYCDPDSTTRIAREDWEKRERYWLEQLETFDGFPAIFIMGANHFDSFNSLLKESGLKCTLRKGVTSRKRNHGVLLQPRKPFTEHLLRHNRTTLHSFCEDRGAMRRHLYVKWRLN
jgi:hypothetical protein